MRLIARPKIAVLARRNPIGAAPRAGHDMLGPLDGNARAENISEQVELVGTEALTGRRGGANGAMILRKEEVAPGLPMDFGHIALFGADARERLQLATKGGRWWDALGV